MKTSKLLKILIEDGWFLLRHGANHDIYQHPTKEGIVIVPRHGAREIRKGTENKILKQAGLK